jgi:hypothetical protein
MGDFVFSFSAPSQGLFKIVQLFPLLNVRLFPCVARSEQHEHHGGFNERITSISFPSTVLG